MIGLSPPKQTQLQARPLSANDPAPVFPATSAAKADPPFQFGDRIVATTDPDDLGRLFIVEKTGKIEILDFHSGQILATPFLEVTCHS